MQKERGVEEVIESLGWFNQPLACFSMRRPRTTYDTAVCLKFLNRCFYAETPLKPFFLLEKKFLKSQHLLFGGVHFIQFHRHPRM